MKFLATLQGLLQDGAFNKAVKHILSDGLHDTLDPKVQEKLAALHPDRAALNGIPPHEPWPWDNSPEGQRERLNELRSITRLFRIFEYSNIRSLLKYSNTPDRIFEYSVP